jgi:ribose transport system substrate-binding protein
MKLSTILTGIALTGSLMLAGCNKSSDTTTGGGGGGGGAKALHLAFVTNNAANFWTIARKGTEQATKELDNVTVDFLIPSQATAAEQKTIIDDLLAKGVDGIAMSPIDPANQTQMINDAAKQALIFTQDSDAPDSDRACYIGTDNKAAGKQAGEMIKEALPNGGKIMVFVGKIDAQNAKDRFEGIKEALAGSNVQILDVRTDNTDTVRAKANVTDTLVTVPDVAGLVGLWSYNGPAILNAVKEAGKIGQVKIVCFDEEDETLAGVKDGSIFGTVVQQPFEFGRQAITLMTKYLRGDKSVVPADKRIIVPTLAINKTNVDDFSVKLDAMLGRTK